MTATTAKVAPTSTTIDFGGEFSEGGVQPLGTLLGEGLSDRQAADAVRGRLDWKYLLGLELSDPGFDHTVLVEFRQRLLSGKHDLLLFDLLLTRLREAGYLKVRGRQRSDSTHVLAKICSLNRVEGVGETVRAALNSLAVAAPEWLKGQMQEDWVDRYQYRILKDGEPIFYYI